MCSEIEGVENVVNFIYYYWSHYYNVNKILPYFLFYNNENLVQQEETILSNYGYFKIWIYVMRCAIWYHLCKLKNVKNYHGGVHFY